MHPLKNFFLRATGIAPLVGPIPLFEEDYRDLFKAETSFADYFPVEGYDRQNGVFTMVDGINVGAVWECTPADMDAKPEETLAAFNDALAKALSQLPQEKDNPDNPYIVQIYLQNADIDNLGDHLHACLPEHLREDKLSLDVVRLLREHSDLLTHELGAFQDTRVAQEKGWRVATQKIYVCIYRLESEAYWKRQRKTPAKKLLDDVGAFLGALNGMRIQAKPLDGYGLIRWLAPYFAAGHDKVTSRAIYDDKQQLANFDLGQECFAIQPEYRKSEDAGERGIWKFGDRYLRYLTTHGLEAVPEDGCLSIGREGDASPWEQMPPGTMMVWTIAPQPKVMLDGRIDAIKATAQISTSSEAEYTLEQADTAKSECLRNGQRIFYTQVGAYISAPNYETLLDRTLVASDTLLKTNCLSFIRAEDDLISQDSFVRALPFVYDFRHDRKAALRARMTYLSQLSSILPFFGSGRGSDNLCYLGYKRSGEPFMCNPFLKSDRSRVAHQMVFGPTGAGKSATMISMALMSMAVNAPRQFILDKGNSFGLLADYYEAMGKKVRRMTFSANSTDTFPPFYETEKALREADNSGRPQERNDAEIAGDDDEERSYLSEMLNTLRIMVTGGKQRKAEELTQADMSFLQDALIKGLRASQEKGDPHARPQDVHEAMLALAAAEESETLKLRYREFAAAIKFWTEGPRGRLFNQHGDGFDADADLTLIETGWLTNEGNEDMFAVAGLATLTNITALGERTQADGRHIEVYTDEGHYWMKLVMLILGMIRGIKVWRKLGIWLIFGTQDFSDFHEDARKILSQAEFWWLLSMGEDEAQQISRFKNLTPEEHYLIRQAKIEKPNYTEGTMLSDRFGCGLIRYIPPSLVLALAQTDADEKNARKRLMDEHGISELEAAIRIADQISASRRRWQNRFSPVPVATPSQPQGVRP
ncbi:MAG: conjugative transfer ATPase [Cardiobacterium sp.]